MAGSFVMPQMNEMCDNGLNKQRPKSSVPMAKVQTD